MEDAWQLRGGTHPSQQWANWQGTANQVDLGTGRYLNPYATQDISLIEKTARQDPTFPHLLSLNTQASQTRGGKSHASHSILALSQENIQPSQCEFQRTASSCMAYMVPNQLWYSASPSDNGGWPLMTSGNPSFTGKLGTGTPANSIVMTEFAQGVQGVDMNQLSRAGGASKFDPVASRQGGLEMYRHALAVNPHLGDVDVQCQYQLPSWQAPSSYIEKQASLLFKSSAQPVVEQAQRKPLHRPRVLCPGISGSLLGGELTMSETGRLGVICSCHNVHMSVAKFSEHAGLFAANPGSGILLESGESLVQWRKNFFSQFGVKVPEDNMGWEWDAVNGMEGDKSVQKVAYMLGNCKEPELFLQGDYFSLKNGGSLHSSTGFGQSNLSSRRSAGVGLIYGDTSQSRSQDLGAFESTVLEKSYKGFTSNGFNESLALSQKPFNVTTRNQGTNSTHFFWGNESGPSSVSEQASFAKLGSQSSKHLIDNSSAFNEKSTVELCGGRYPAQNMEQVKNDLATSNFELRLGQPSQQNLSLGSIYSDSLQSRSSCGPQQHSRPGIYGLANQTRWEQSSSENVNHSAVGRQSMIADCMNQANVGTYTTSWLLRSNQQNKDFSTLQTGLESDKQRNIPQVQSRTVLDPHTLQMFPKTHKHTEVADAPYTEASHSDIIVQSSENRECDQRRVELSPSDYSTFTTLNAYPTDLPKEDRSDSQYHQPSPLLIRPTVKNLEAVRNIDGMFMNPPEKHRSVMDPADMNAVASEASMMKGNTAQSTAARSVVCESSLTTWAKQTSFLESFSSSGQSKLPEGTSNAVIYPRIDKLSTLQNSSVHTENAAHAGDGASTCPSVPATAKVCAGFVNSTERSKDLENQGVNRQNEISQVVNHMSTNPPYNFTDSGLRLANEAKTLADGRSVGLEEQNQSEMGEEVCNRANLDKVQSLEKPATRENVQDLKGKELSTDPLIIKHSSVGKACLSDQGIRRNDVDAEADSVGLEVAMEESPLSFRSPNELEKASFDGSSVNAKMEEKRSSRTLRSTVDSTTKELARNDVLDEGSGIGKCSSSIEADMEAMTSTGPISSHANVQALESQTSMANSSSSNAVISDTLSNTMRVRKLFAEERSTTVTHADLHGVGKSMQRMDKRGRRAMKWKCPGVTTSKEGERQERLSQLEDGGSLGAMSKTLTSDDTFWTPMTKGLKRKRSALSGPDLATSKMVTSITERSSREFGEAEQILRWGGSKAVLRLPKETSMKQIKECSLNNSEKLFPKPKRARCHDLRSTFSVNASSKLKAIRASGRSKTLPSFGSSLKHARGVVERPEVKSVKTASLSSILDVPKAGSQSKKASDMRCHMPFDSLQSRVSHIKFRQASALAGGGTPDVLGYPQGGVNTCSLAKHESGKRSFWEMADRPNQQNKVSWYQTMATAGKRISSQASDFEGKMVTVPLKFIAAKRLEPEVLRKESKDLLISTADHDSLSGRLVKRLRPQVTNTKPAHCSPMLHAQVTKTKPAQCSMLHAQVTKTKPAQCTPMLQSKSKGSMSDDEDDTNKRVRNRRKRKGGAKSTSKLKNKQQLVCCICGEQSVQTNNVIVKCDRCGLGVHQACYGVTEVSKKPWICRPCKANTSNIVCVLCGYGQGAMTRAKKSEVLAKGLVQAWRGKDAKKETPPNSVTRNAALELSQSCIDPGPRDVAIGHRYSSKIQEIVKKDGSIGMPQEEFKLAQNSVINGIDDLTVTQWVHVVCALWMPGTRCINVETMAAFDVSGVARAARRSVCSICNRAGGACIKCRVAKCGTPFHPWCAHGKGLLQNEAFGGEEDKVGFFGKCLVHGSLVDKNLEETPVAKPVLLQSPNDCGSCARTEGGYKRGETSFGKKMVDPASLGVLQEDVTAWLSKKEHRRSARRFLKLANCDVKSHHREYVRYKQEQRWKRLAVYKSSIHALGLYTSESIAKGEMVVEYVGEVIGLRVADKREADYLSSGRLQYRGACYLFRVDEEHIIDATRKGGIARFVNHSCSPNCVAKIISVEKQKKVVFFAEKDIAAGEELTYDYKLDFETENRLPCYCKSAQCRGFLN